jgi:hypothetical protein
VAFLALMIRILSPRSVWTTTKILPLEDRPIRTYWVSSAAIAVAMGAVAGRFASLARSQREWSRCHAGGIKPLGDLAAGPLLALWTRPFR